MTRRRLTSITALALAAAAQAALADVYDAPGAYYTPATATDGATLKFQLNDIIDSISDGPTDAEDVALHVRNYNSTAVNALDYLDEDPGNPLNVIEVYSGNSIPKSTFPSTAVQREHLWCNSYGINDHNPGNSELFNLRPIDGPVNADRGTEYYDEPPVTTR
jgi:endonuclease I